jgi:hypothetical protein
MVVILPQDEIVFSAKYKCMDDITSITVSYNENIYPYHTKYNIQYGLLLLHKSG